MGKDYGGQISLRLSTGELISLRGTFNLSPSRTSVESVTNQDGSLDRVATPKPGRAEISFADRGIDYDALMRGPRFNATFIEDFSGVTHYLTDAFVVGDPVQNRVNGEVTGASLEFAKYRRANA